jgi:hypothetical protein
MPVPQTHGSAAQRGALPIDPKNRMHTARGACPAANIRCRSSEKGKKNGKAREEQPAAASTLQP